MLPPSSHHYISVITQKTTTWIFNPITTSNLTKSADTFTQDALIKWFRECIINHMRGCIQSFRTESITKYTLTKINTRWEVTQRVIAAKLTRLTLKIAIQLHLVAESCTICIYCSRRPVRKLLDTSSLFWFQIRSYGTGLHRYPGGCFEQNVPNLYKETLISW
jgi:hypothetical protein